MAKAGRKRKGGLREPNGRLVRPTVERLNSMAAEARRREQSVVLMQPHRGGRACGSGPDPRRDVERTVVAGKVIETVVDKQDIRTGRIGTEHKLAECPIGRLALRHGLDQVLVDVGLDYAALYSRRNGSWSGPRGVGTPPSGKGGEGPTMQASARDRRLIMVLEQAMMRAGGIQAVVAVQQLVLIIGDTAPEQDHAAITGLMAIAMELGRWDKKRAAFPSRHEGVDSGVKPCNVGN